jgi:hypothetical protein
MNISLMVDITEHYSNVYVFFDAQTDEHHVPDKSDNGEQMHECYRQSKVSTFLATPCVSRSGRDRTADWTLNNKHNICMKCRNHTCSLFFKIIWLT